MKTLGELKSAIRNWLNRTDLDDIIPDFIRLAEDNIYRDLRSRENEFHQIIVPDLVGPPVVDPINPIPLPDNFKELKLVSINSKPMEIVSDQEIYARNRTYGADYAPDMAYYAAVIGRELMLHPWPKETPDDWGEMQIDIHYYGTESLLDLSTWNVETNPTDDPPVEDTVSSTPQTDLNTTRLLQVAPSAYLFGSLVEAYLYLLQDEKAALYRERFNGAMEELRTENSVAEYAGSTVAVSNTYDENVRRPHARRY